MTNLAALAAPSAPRPGDGIVRATLAELLALREHGRHLTLKSISRSAQQSGTRRSRFRARGMDYEESRRYQPGDDMRNLDWRVMARTGHPFTKLYREERERPVFICVDLSASMFFATRGVYKAVKAAHCAALLAWAVMEHGDRVGGIIFGGDRAWERRPQRGKRGVLGLLHDLADSGNWDHEDDVAHGDMLEMTRAIARVAHPGSLVAVISDFRNAHDEELANLRRIAVHSDLLNVYVSDPLEHELPPAGRYPIFDRGRRFVLDTGASWRRERHRARFAERLERVQKLHAQCGARCIHVQTGDDAARTMGEALRGVLR